jgi:hypothetical protein
VTRTHSEDTHPASAWTNGSKPPTHLTCSPPQLDNTPLTLSLSTLHQSSQNCIGRR